VRGVARPSVDWRARPGTASRSGAARSAALNFCRWDQLRRLQSPPRRRNGDLSASILESGGLLRRRRVEEAGGRLQFRQRDARLDL
jgi:hypothetical protein